ncbi:helix-turn-helix domain-containing protein [Armatimonas sp.]|uniref:helix-turn-helix domain-containing protein n=1 Tax=Armatimonas sp. TaxID=1872638 RepID=UPI00286ABC3A|nr:helix-turn-helix domain-containing protein [Armatimonas sp.]
MPESLSILTPSEVAEILKVPEEVVIAEFTSGRLKGFQLGGQWRTTLDYLRELVTTPMSPPTEAPALPVSSSPRPIPSDPVKKEIPELKQFQAMQSNVIAPFSYQWPHNAGAVGTNLESYDEAYQCHVEIAGNSMPFVIAFCDRPAAGMANRRRGVIFRGQAKKTLYPMVEFTGANDFQETGKMASVIRVDGRKAVRPGSELPTGYSDMPIGIYNEVVVGPNAWHAVAVVAHNTDFPVMIKHAMLRQNN